MKSLKFLSLITLLSMVMLTGCLKDSCVQTVSYIKVEPIYKTYDEIHATEVKTEAARELVNPGKLYYYNDYIFINEGRDGVHVIDNRDRSNPENIAFISIPGNEDVAVKDGVMYANSYVDLLALNIDDLLNVTLIGRTENVFPPIWDDVNAGRVLVYYENTPVTEEVDCNTYGLFQRGYDDYYYYCPNCLIDEVVFDANVLLSSTVSGAGVSNSSATVGISGSMARFSIVKDYLYVVDNNNMHIFGLNDPVNVQETNEVQLGWGIETLFSFGDYLFIGSNSGMVIYSISEASSPSYVSEFQHATACDPVFVNDNYAYVTLRDGTACQGFVNQLDVVDITDITSPKLEASFSMDNPHGLSIKNDVLLLCEGDFGFKTFDDADPLQVGNKLLDHLKDFSAYDVIALPGHEDVAFIIGKDGFYQYDFSNPESLQLLSVIPVSK